MKIEGSYKNLLNLYEKADAVDIKAGMLAYQKYHTLMQILAWKYHYPVPNVTAVFVSTSPNNDYKGNLRSTVSILEGCRNNIPKSKIKISTYNHCRDRAIEYLCYGKSFIHSTKGKKILSFYYNILDPHNPVPVTVDGHMVSAWAGKRFNMKSVAQKNFSYEKVAQDIRDVAGIIKLIPCQLQSILWLTWKRINHIRYNDNLDLFGDHWGLDIDVTKIKPYV